MFARTLASKVAVLPPHVVIAYPLQTVGVICNWLEISVKLNNSILGEEKAQSCENARFRQL
jgi:hypothetical protein